MRCLGGGGSPCGMRVKYVDKRGDYWCSFCAAEQSFIGNELELLKEEPCTQ